MSTIRTDLNHLSYVFNNKSLAFHHTSYIIHYTRINHWHPPINSYKKINHPISVIIPPLQNIMLDLAGSPASYDFRRSDQNPGIYLFTISLVLSTRSILLMYQHHEANLNQICLCMFYHSSISLCSFPLLFCCC